MKNKRLSLWRYIGILLMVLCLQSLGTTSIIKADSISVSNGSGSLANSTASIVFDNPKDENVKIYIRSNVATNCSVILTQNDTGQEVAKETIGVVAWQEEVQNQTYLYTLQKELVKGSYTLTLASTETIQYTVTVESVASPVTYRINKQKVTLYAGNTVQLKVDGLENVEWSSNNKKVAKVDANGLVLAQKKGKAIIRADYNDNSYACVVTVKNNETKKKKITVKGSKAGIHLQVYHAQYKNDALVCKVQIVNHSSMTIRDIYALTVNIKNKKGTVLASATTTPHTKIGPNSCKAVTLRVPQSAWGNQNVILSKINLEAKGKCKSSW